MINEEIAEFYGALSGDGCLSTYYSNYDKRQRSCIVFTGHTHDKKYYEKTIQPIFIKYFGTKGNIKIVKNANAIRFVSYNKKAFNFFKSLNFPIGLKTKLLIPQEIIKNKIFSIAYVRGVFDTDGSIYSRYSKKYNKHSKIYDYKNIQFKMNSLSVIKFARDTLIKNQIKVSKIKKDNKAFVFRIHDQNSIKRFFKIFKPNNKYHTGRFLK